MIRTITLCLLFLVTSVGCISVSKDKELGEAERNANSSVAPECLSSCTWNGSPHRLHLLSWNVHAIPGAPRQLERARAISASVLCRQPDVVLLQEVWPVDMAIEFVRQLSATYQRVPATDPADQYKSVLGLYSLRRTGLIAFVRKDSLPNAAGIRSGYWKFEESASPLLFWQGDGLSDKGFQWITIQDADQEIVVLNTHLQAQYDNFKHDDVRRAQLKQLARYTASQPEQSIVIAAGDFNTKATYVCDGKPQCQPFGHAPAGAGSGESVGHCDSIFDEISNSWELLTEPYMCAYPNGTYLEGKPPKSGKANPWVDFFLASKSGKQVEATHFCLLENSAPDIPFSDHNGLEIWLDY